MSSNDQPSFNRPFDSQTNGNSGDDGNAFENVTADLMSQLTMKNSTITANDQSSWVNVEPTSKIASWTHQRVLREKNKDLRVTFEDEGLSYGNDVSEEELKSRMSTAVDFRKASIAKMLKILNASKTVQLCFLVDVTGSMATYIQGVRDSIYKIVEKLTEKHATIAGNGAIAKQISMAFVGYRDFGVEDQFELLHFTESAEDFRRFCSGVTAESAGNTDHPEDVFGGLEKAIFDLSWSDISMCTKVIFHIADHPCHGRMYQASTYHWYPDRYPNGDPNGHTADNLFNSLREKGIQYYFGKVTSYTDKMIEMFSEAMGNEIMTYDIKQVDTLTDKVVSSVSIAMSVHPSMAAKPAIINTDRAIPDWSKLTIFTGVFLSYEMPECIDDVIDGVLLTQKNPTKAKVQIANIPFAHGSERKVFYGRDSTNDVPTGIVLKEYIKKNAVRAYESATEMQTIAAYLASRFIVRLLKKAEIVYNIKFLKVQVLSIQIKPGENRFMSCERFYGTDCKFLRFSNNYDYEMLESTCTTHNVPFDVVEQLMAFSHWTYQISRGYLMVVDLQGVLGTDENGRKTLELTDPAIHCTDLTRFGRTNLGLDGMKIFFGRHVCNKFCHAMDLKQTIL